MKREAIVEFQKEQLGLNPMVCILGWAVAMVATV